MKTQINHLFHNLNTVQVLAQRVESKLDDVINQLSEVPNQSDAAAPTISTDVKLDSLAILLTSTRSAIQQNFFELQRLSANVTDLQTSNNLIRDQIETIQYKQLTEISPTTETGTQQVVNEYSAIPASCSEVQPNNGSGVYRIRAKTGSETTFYAYCHAFETGRMWTVILNRADDTTSFYRSWADYKKGFGNVNKNFWIGLDKLSEVC